MSERDVPSVYELGEEPKERARGHRLSDGTLLRFWLWEPSSRASWDSHDACLVPPVGPRLGAALNGRVGEGRR